MTHIWQGLRSGQWLTAARARGYSLILLGIGALAVAGWIALSDGLIDRNGKPIGTDFSNVYAAGKLTWQGRPAEAYEPALQHAEEKAVFGGREVPFYGWHYPPFFFAVAFIVAAFPYAWGLALWVAASLAAYLVAIRAILPRPETLLTATAFPAVFVNIGHGQNGFLTAALLGGALQLLDIRPWLAGVLIGCLAYKPQFGVLIPIALLAGGRWSTIAAAMATVAALVALSFATLGVGVCLAWLWHGGTAFELKAAALATASLLATPYVLDYDLVVLAVAIAFFARHGLRHGFRAFEISLLAAAWIVPLLSRGIAQATGIPLGLAVLLTLYALILRRAVLDRAHSPAGTHGFAQA